MKQATIQITFEEENCAPSGAISPSAIRRWKRSCKKAAQRLYEKVVPTAVQEYISDCTQDEPVRKPQKEIGGAGMSTAGFHVTEDCAEVYLQTNPAWSFCSLPDGSMIISSRNSACQRGVSLEATDDCKRSAARRSMRWQSTAWRTPTRSAECLSWTLTRGRFLALNIMDGWKVYAMQDVADAAEQAFQEAEDFRRCTLAHLPRPAGWTGTDHAKQTHCTEFLFRG